MDRRHLCFALVLAVFTAWVITLGFLAVRTSEPPQPKMTTGGEVPR